MNEKYSKMREKHERRGIIAKVATYPYRFDAIRNPKTAVFLDELRAEATGRNNARDIVRILKNESDAFLGLPKDEKETIIRSYIRASRGKISDAYLCSSIVSIKSLFERYELLSRNYFSQYT